MIKKKIFITGHKGLVGSAIKKVFERKKKYKILTVDRKKLNLLDQKRVDYWLKKNKPDIVIHAAGKVGGILHNKTYPAEFIYQNAQMALNIINYSFENNVRKLINLGSACIYPKFAPQPIKEEYLLSGKLESSNEAYAIAKILSLKMTEFYNNQYRKNYISLQPTNLYGNNDNFNTKSGHVIPSLISKFHNAKIHNKKIVEVWGTGKVKREFLYVDDLAEAIEFLLNKKINYNLINIGSGEEVTIKKLSNIISNVVGYKGKIVFNSKYPDGTPRKVVDSKIMRKIGWKHKVDLKTGLKIVYETFRKKYDNN